CSFVEKVHGAQLGGAAGVIVINNNSSRPDEILAMGGSDATVNTITIPCVMVSYNSGVLLKTALAAGATIVGSLKRDNIALPKKDGDFDNGIIAHEYGHGISNRLSPQSASGGSLGGSEQGGEGWSDYIALYVTTTVSDLSASSPVHPHGILPNHGIGTYVQYTGFNGPGIRPRLYSIDESINEYTYTGETNGGKGINNAPEITIPHGVGFVWCTMLWDMTQNLIDKYGFNDNKYYNPPSTGNFSADSAAIAANNAGNNLALKLILKGISLQATSPNFVQMRDGILQADLLLYNGAHQCLIWKAFAKRGLGLNAVAGTNAVGDEVDGYATPCNTTQVFYNIEKSAITLMPNKNTISYTITVSNTSPFNVTGYTIEVLDVLSDEMIFLSASGAGYTQSNDSLFFTIVSLAQGQSVVLTVNAFIDAPTTSLPVAFYDFESGSQGWIPITGGSNEFTYTTNAAQAHSGSSFYYTTNNGLNGPNTMLLSPILDTTIHNRQLRFWHKFGTDAGYDGGFIETSQNGAQWTRLPLQVNGYNGALNSTFNPANAGAAFTGLIPDYIESAGSLPDGAILVRFVFSEDLGLGGGDGWWIDDIRLVQNPVTVTNRVFVDDPIASGGRTHSASATTLIMPAAPVNACSLVSITTDEGVGSLPFAIGCAASGDTIRFAIALHDDTIQLVNHKAIISKNLVFDAFLADSIFISGAGVDHTFEIYNNGTIVLNGLHVIAGTGVAGAALFNAGDTKLRNVRIYERATGNVGPLVHNATGAVLKVSETTIIYKD
ncbi:MAG: M36 family metallopeptidase, partial [Saprospiraceae bacterium]